MSTRDLEALARPTSVAVVGASRRCHAVGNVVLRNILDGGFAGRVFAVNPHRIVVDGALWLGSIDDLPEAPSLAIVATAAAGVPDILRRLAKRGAKLAVVLANGFEDEADRRSIRDAAGGGGMRVIGPNCLGVVLPRAGLNAGFGPMAPPAGRLALLSQSGAIVAGVADWARDRGVGFSSMMAVGDAVDVDLADLVDFHAEDAGTDAILLHLEGIGDAQKFVSAVRAAAALKPVVALKAGRSPGTARAVTSHTGAMVGAYDAYEAALRRAGALLADSHSDLLDAARILGTARRHCGPRLAVVTNGGGAGILAADAAERRGATLAPLARSTIDSLSVVLPRGWSHGDPIDVLGDAGPERFTAAVHAVLDDPGVDAVLVVHCPTAIDAPQAVAHATVLAAAASSKPVIGCWLGPDNARMARSEFDAADLPLFDTIDGAVTGWHYLRQASEARGAALRSPAPRISMGAHDVARARAVVAAARREGRTMLHGAETRSMLEAYGIPTCPSRFAPDLRSLAAACKPLSAPYALKLCSPDLPHKSDAGGVALDLADAAAVTAAAAAMLARISATHPGARVTGFDVQSMVRAPHARELIAGIVRDPTFGPLLMFGAGGTAVEVLGDRAVELPPLDDDMARAMIGRTRVGRLLEAYRDVPAADADAIVRTLEALSALAVDFPDIDELDINPLTAGPAGVIAVDARMTISAEPRERHMAIRPWPSEWEAALPTRGGLLLRVRPVRPDDEALLADLFRHVSADDLRFRFLAGLREVRRDRIVAMTRIDYRRAMHFLGFVDGLLVASALLVADAERAKSEVAVSVREGFKGKGVSWALMQHVLAYARAEGIREITSVESVENSAALRLEHEMGFETTAAEGAERTVRKLLRA